jgi:hypothetical protein
MKPQSVQSVGAAAAGMFLRALTRSPLPLPAIRPPPRPEQQRLGPGAGVAAAAACLLSAAALLAAARRGRR